MTPSSPSADEGPVWARDAARKAARRDAPSFKRLIVNLIAVAVVAAVVAFFAAPVVTFFGIRAAAEAGDVAGLAKLIDYDAVRASLRPQLSGRPEPLTPPPSFIQDPIGAVRRQFDQAVTPRAPDAPDVEAYLSPRAIWGLTWGTGRDVVRPTGGTHRGEPFSESGQPPIPRPVYWSVNRTRLAVTNDGGARTVFTFERRGPYDWKLVHIGLAEDSATQP